MAYMMNSVVDVLPTSHNHESEKQNPSLNWDKSIEIPKYNSFSPSISDLSPPPISPSYLSFTPGFSSSLLLDSPLLFSSSNILPSPTIGAIAGLSSKENEAKYSEFSFQSQTQPSDSSFSSSAGMNSMESYLKIQQQDDQFNTQNKPRLPAYPREQKKLDDGYNWRKYGQKQVKSSENPRSYYKCSFPYCPTKKKVELDLDGQVTEIVYRGSHIHPKPQPGRRSYGSFEKAHVVTAAAMTRECSFTKEHDIEPGSSLRKSRDEDEIEREAKRWKGDDENEGVSGNGSQTVREARIVVQTMSEIDILDDGYRWRKYGQKVVKGNPNPRSYYKCTSAGCPVRKHVERAGHNSRAVITTYEGKHNHNVPAARGSGSSTVSQPPVPDTAGRATAINAPAVPKLQMSRDQRPCTLKMVQDMDGDEFSGFGSPTSGGQVAKQEPREELFFDSFFNF